MNKKNYKLLSILIALAMLFSISVIFAHAEDLSDDVVICAEEMRAEYHKAVDNISEEICKEFLTNSYEANITYNRILNLIESNDNELRSHFSGAYVNNDGYLVIALCCDTGNCRKEIEDNLAESDVIFEDGIGSYYYGQKELDAVNKEIASLQECIKNNEDLPTNIKTLMQSKPRTIYNTENNTFSVIFNVSADVEKAVLKNEELKNTANTKSSQIELSNSELQAVKQYNDLISTFKDCVHTSEKISYIVCTGYEQGEDETEAWRPGRYLFVYSNPSAGMGSQISTGYRAKYTYDSITYYGFVTCGHGTNVGNAVYISNSVSSTNKLGIILNRSYGNRIDVSFIRMTNSNYTNGQAIYYTSSQAGVTRPGTVLDGTQTTPALNTGIYKSGSSTYLTWGYLSSNTCSGYWNDTYFYSLMQADRNMSSAGDSGAVTYIINGATIYGKAIGVLKGKYSGNTVFVKASNITADFGAVAY